MSLEFTLVRRAISLAVIDGPDAGDNPDILQAQGSVLFEPVIKKGDSIQVQTRGGSETYALAPIECPINDGIISHRGQDGVKLPAGGKAANPSLIRWKATFSRMQAGGKSFTLAPVIFDAVPGGEIDLTMVAPVAGAPEGVVRGPRGTSLESILVDGSELVFTAVDDAGSFEIARIPLDEMVRAEAEAAADGVRDALAVDVAASQSARDVAEGHANRAATSESNAAASETNAKQSETNAGDYAAVATTAATEAVDAMETASDAASSIGDSVNEAARHATRASQSESGAAAYAQNASDAADRVGTAEQVGTWAQQAQDAADRIGTAEAVEGWADSARNSASAAAQSESKTKEYSEAAKASETNAKTHETNARSAADRAEFAAEETIQQVEGDFATRNYVDSTIANALRVDTSVGTRVFAGNMMIHGDTGLRRINDLATGLDFTTSTLYKAVIYRVGYEVHLSAIGLSLGIQNITEGLPYGFRPIAGTYHSNLGSMYQSGQILSVGNPSSTNRISVVTAPRSGVGVALRVSWRTADPWPTTLPGIPD